MIRTRASLEPPADDFKKAWRKILIKRDLQAEEEFIKKNFNVIGNFDQIEQLAKMAGEFNKEAADRFKQLLLLARAEYEAERNGIV